MQLVELQDMLPELGRAGCALFAISYDPVSVLAEFSNRHSIAFPLLSDEGSRVIDQLGVRDRDLVAHHEAMGVATRDDQQGVAYPVTFVLDADGRVERKTIEKNYRLRDGGRRLLQRLTGVTVPAVGVVREERRGVLRARLQLDKQADIAILRTLGLTPRAVMQVFMVQGSMIGVIGTVLGVIGGILLTLNLESILQLIERMFGIVLLPSDVYYITGLPTELQASDVATIAMVALAMAFVATLYPAWRAARTAPAEALRYE